MDWCELLVVDLTEWIQILWLCYRDRSIYNLWCCIGPIVLALQLWNMALHRHVDLWRQLQMMSNFQRSVRFFEPMSVNSKAIRDTCVSSFSIFVDPENWTKNSSYTIAVFLYRLCEQWNETTKLVNVRAQKFYTQTHTTAGSISHIAVNDRHFVSIVTLELFNYRMIMKYSTPSSFDLLQSVGKTRSNKSGRRQMYMNT